MHEAPRNQNDILQLLRLERNTKMHRRVREFGRRIEITSLSNCPPWYEVNGSEEMEIK